ncbi:MAG: hypothetical protein LLG20_11385, partial [Acidobacteriales bacterium]|nr:hypothetical protein [Terriglobales bacterium]
YADGRTTNLADVLPSCSTHPVPCGGGYLDSFRGKQFGMSAGAGNVPAMLAHILSEVPLLEERDVPMGFSRSTNSAAAGFPVKRFDGSTVQKSYPSASSAVQNDRKKGGHLVKPADRT